MNRLAQHLAAISATIPDAPPTIRDGEMIYAVMLWKRTKGAKWRPNSPTAIPPHIAGTYSIIWTINRELGPVLREVLDWNTSALEVIAKGKRVRTWAVPVRAVCGHDETARIIDTSTLRGIGGAA
jgi:hypothetical protein